MSMQSMPPVVTFSDDAQMGIKNDEKKLRRAQKENSFLPNLFETITIEALIVYARLL